jgi:hypothetical protein
MATLGTTAAPILLQPCGLTNLLPVAEQPGTVLFSLTAPPALGESNGTFRLGLPFVATNLLWWQKPSPQSHLLWSTNGSKCPDTAVIIDNPPSHFLAAAATTHPQDSTVYAWQNVTRSWKWQRRSLSVAQQHHRPPPIPPSTLVNAQPSDGYYMAIANAFGTARSKRPCDRNRPAPAGFVTAPIQTPPPAHDRISIVVSGTAPISYQRYETAHPLPVPPATVSR